MNMSARRVRAVVRKELREYRRSSQIVITMAVIPIAFVILPLAEIFAVPTSAAGALQHQDTLLYMLGIPALAPAVVAAYAVVGERQQGTLEPVLTTPVRREELLLGKALAAFIPSVVIAYAIYAGVLASVGLFAHPGVASAIVRVPELIAQLVFTPLLAGWSIWVGLGFSARSNDVRSAQQLGALASLPSIAVTTMIAFNVIHPTLGLAIGAAAALLALDVLGWRVVSASFVRERLITGTRS